MPYTREYFIVTTMGSQFNRLPSIGTFTSLDRVSAGIKLDEAKKKEKEPYFRLSSDYTPQSSEDKDGNPCYVVARGAGGVYVIESARLNVPIARGKKPSVLKNLPR